MIVRSQSGLPAVGEILEPFAFPHTVAGCMRGSHHAPLMPVAVIAAHPSRFDGPPRVVSLGFQITNGHFIGPRDMFADPSFDRARATANEVMDYLRRHGPFEPHRLPLDEMEYTTMPAVRARAEWPARIGSPSPAPAAPQRPGCGSPAGLACAPGSDELYGIALGAGLDADLTLVTGCQPDDLIDADLFRRLTATYARTASSSSPT